MKQETKSKRTERNSAVLAAAKPPAPARAGVRRVGFVKGYGGEHAMPLGGYAVLLATYAAVFGSVAFRARRKGGLGVPEVKDLVLLGIATHKLSRLVTRDWVTAPLRAPFTAYQGSTGAGEVKETSRGTGLRRAIGDLMTCPYCSGAWIATGFVALFGFYPRLARILAAVLAVEALSDHLHLEFNATRRAGLKEG